MVQNGTFQPFRLTPPKMDSAVDKNGNPIASRQGPVFDVNKEIQFPGMVSYKDVLPGMQTAVGKAPVLSSIQSIPGFDQTYWDNLYNQSKNRFQSQYFGPNDSLQTKMIEDMNTRGLLGTGAEVSAQGTLNKSYGEQLADLESNLSKTQADQKMQESRDLRQLQQERDLKSGDWDMQNRELALRSALTDAAEQNKFGIGQFEQQVKLEDVRRQDYLSRQKMWADLLQSPYYDVGDNAPYANAVLTGNYGTQTPTYASVVDQQKKIADDEQKALIEAQRNSWTDPFSRLRG